MTDLDLLVDAAILQGQLAAGVKPAVVAARAGDKRLITVLGSAAPAVHNPRWNQTEEEYLRASLGFISEAEIATELGRSPIAVHMHWRRELRLPAPSRDLRVLTANQVAEGMGADLHVVANWFDRGMFPCRRLPTDDVTRVVERDEFLRWLLEPTSWIYFNPRRVGKFPTPRAGDIYDQEFWAETRRQLDRARADWADEWWTTRQVANYHGITPKDVLRHIQLGRLHGVQTENHSGRHPNQYWRLWFVRRSEAIAARLPCARTFHSQETTMNVTPVIKQVTDYNFTISQQDLERYLADPQAWADDVRSQLNGNTPAAVKKTRKANTKNGHKGTDKVKCPQCGKLLMSQGMLERHLRQKHGQAESVSAAKSDSMD